MGDIKLHLERPSLYILGKPRQCTRSRLWRLEAVLTYSESIKIVTSEP